MHVHNVAPTPVGMSYLREHHAAVRPCPESRLGAVAGHTHVWTVSRPTLTGQRQVQSKLWGSRWNGDEGK